MKLSQGKRRAVMSDTVKEESAIKNGKENVGNKNSFNAFCSYCYVIFKEK